MAGSAISNRSRLGPSRSLDDLECAAARLSMALMWWFPPGGGLLRFGWFVLSSVVFMAASRVNCPIAPLPPSSPKTTEARTRLNAAPAHAARFSAAWWGLLLGALLVGLRRPGLTSGDGAGRRKRSRWWAHRFRAGPGPAARVCRGLGAPERSQPSWGRMPAQWPLPCACGFVSAALGALAIECSRLSLLYLSEVNASAPVLEAPGC